MGVYGRGDIPTQADIEKAAKAAGAHEFILELPQKYDTLIEESGQNISGGQKQRIALARAFLRDSPVFLLDEPTSALDIESEIIIQDSLKRLTDEKTVLIVSHRLESIKESDRILFLEKGSVIEEGTHEALMLEKGAYYDLYMSDNPEFAQEPV